MINVTIDGVEYQPVQRGDEVRILIGQRGWVWVGYYAEDGDAVTLTGARNIRRWGTTNGVGGLVDGPNSGTVLDPAGTVRLHALGVVATLDADTDAWKEHLG